MPLSRLYRYAAILTLVLSSAAAGADARPRLVKATYNAYLNGMSIGVLTEQLESDGASYRIVSDTKPIGLAAFIQRNPLRFASSGRVTAQGLKPDHFEGRRSAGEAPQVSADFDWGNAQVVLKYKGKTESLPLPAGTQDRLSIMYQFMYMRLDHPRQIEFAMTNGRKLDQYRYRVTPDVEIDTALGRLRTLHLVKQRDPGDTQTEVWLSVQHRHFPVRMLIVERDGMRIEQNIHALEIRE
jgi:hypothetical protein